MPTGEGITRSIPACAGEPLDDSGIPGAVWVYPRVCGGTKRGSILIRAMLGLSPRVRGNPPRRPHH